MIAPLLPSRRQEIDLHPPRFIPVDDATLYERAAEIECLIRQGADALEAAEIVGDAAEDAGTSQRAIKWLPMPAEIAEEARKIRDAWPAEERQARTVQPQWSAPEIGSW